MPRLLVSLVFGLVLLTASAAAAQGVDDIKLDDLKAQYEMYGTIYDRLSQLLNRGRGPTEAVEAKPTKEFDDKMGNPDVFVRRAFESLWAYLSPDA